MRDLEAVEVEHDRGRNAVASFSPCTSRVSPVATFLLALAMLLVTASVTDANDETDLAPRRIRVICRTDPSTTATVSWDTAQQGSRHLVRLAAKGDDQPKIVEARHSGRYTHGSGYFHHARVTGLAPETEYVMTLHSDEQSSDVYRLRTASTNDAPVSLLSVQGPIEGERLVASLAATARAIAKQGPRCTAMLVQCDAAQSFAAWRKWLDMYQQAGDRARPLLPIAPVPGTMQHRQFAELFDFQAGETTYYRLNFGQQLGLIVLDTSISLAGKQRDWLAEEIRSERRERRWLMASYAAAAYPATARPSRVHAHWMRLFDDFHLDLACESERFGYRRTLAVRSGSANAEGAVYVGLGRAPYRTWGTRPRRWYVAPPGMIDRSTGFVLLQFKKDALSITATANDGRKIEDFRMEPRK